MTQAKTHDATKARALEAYLVASARTGDAAALAQLAKLMAPRLLAHASRLMGDADQARDITQTAWIDIQRGLPGLRDVGAFRAFALRIVTRKVAASIKELQRDRNLAAEYAGEAESSAPPLGEIAADGTVVRAAIAALPPDQRNTLALFYLEDLTVTEVAGVLQIPVGTVKTRLMHARAKLRATLKGDDNVET